MGRRKTKSFIEDYFTLYVNNAKTRNLDFLLTKSEFNEITASNCFYCDCHPEPKRVAGGCKQNRVFIANGIDRIDPTIGYILSNCVPCCTFCNRAKSNYPLSYFLEKIVDIYLYSELNPLEYKN